MHEQPTANVRKGDPDEYTQQFVEKGCKIFEHKFGYRSVHYLLISRPTKEQYITELQVRTIFEEGWSEIDHRVRYPYDLGDPILSQLSAIHNRLAGSADEIGSFIQILKRELKFRDELTNEAIEKRDQAIADLEDYVQKLEISNKKKQELEQRLKSLTSIPFSGLQGPEISRFLERIRGVSVIAANYAAIRARQGLTPSQYPTSALANQAALPSASPSKDQQDEHEGASEPKNSLVSDVNKESPLPPETLEVKKTVRRKRSSNNRRKVKAGANKGGKK